MRLHNHNGFLMTEAIIAIAIVGLMLVPLLASYSRIRQRVSDFSNHYDRLLHMNVFLAESQRTRPQDEAEFKAEKKISWPPTDLVYEFGPVSDESSLKKIPGLFFERVIATWKEHKKTKRDTLYTIVFKPQLKVQKQ